MMGPGKSVEELRAQWARAYVAWLNKQVDDPDPMMPKNFRYLTEWDSGNMDDVHPRVYRYGMSHYGNEAGDPYGRFRASVGS